MSHVREASPSPEGRFPPRARVRKRPEFLAIQDRGQRVSTPRFVVILAARSPRAIDALPKSEERSVRLGITASRKVGNAIVRGRAKRLVREAFRATRDLWPPGVDIVVIVKRSTEDTKLDTVIAEFLAARPQIERRARSLFPSRG